MNQSGKYNPMRSYTVFILFFLLQTWGTGASAQDLVVDLGSVDGVALRPGNVLGFRVQNRGSRSVTAEISGRLQYWRSSLGFSYRFRTTLQPGSNTFEQQAGSASWTFSDPALKELFFTYQKLPQGTYEYCVQVQPQQSGGEQDPLNDPDACVYHTVEDMFLINLVDPEDDAKIYEYHPMLSWAVTYPFASELTYRLRVAERKQGQNKPNAITRNNPMYQDNRVMSTASVYPATARPLQLGQPYVWAVDAYYKGILLGGSEVWQFTIIEDSALQPVVAEQSYYEFEQHQGETILNAVGVLKLKYVSQIMQDSLALSLSDEQGHTVRFPDRKRLLVLGDNRIDLELSDKVNLKHRHIYRLQLRTGEGRQFMVPFRYFNPLYIRQ